DHDAVAELDRLTGPQLVRASGTPQHRLHDRVAVAARIPLALARGGPRCVVRDQLSQLAVIGALRESVRLLDALERRAHPTRGKDLTIPGPASRFSASISSAIATIARADSVPGCAE